MKREFPDISGFSPRNLRYRRSFAEAYTDPQFLQQPVAKIPSRGGEQDFYLDLLFYHLKLRCYVVIDLKATEFKPEYSGKMNFYVSAVDDLLRHLDDQPTIGLILCKSRNQTIAEYPLRGLTKPIAISQYRHQLPTDLQAALPTVEQLEAELATIEAEFGAENPHAEP